MPSHGHSIYGAHISDLISTATVGEMSCCSMLILFYMLSTAPVESCGPGNPSYSRRHVMRPLNLGERIPNIPETDLSASGPGRGSIYSGSPEHRRKLVQYINPNVVFRDERGIGDHRLMTRRCSARLHALAQAASAMWPNVKLRVIESWDEELIHPPGSLHYEGRALDISLTDRDNKKYGLLARLAYEVGFDWVHYESRAFIHVSVKDPDHVDRDSEVGCFPSDAIAYRHDGEPLRMENVSIGDEILTIDPSTARIVPSTVVAFADRYSDVYRDYLLITTPDPLVSIELSPHHLIFASQGGRNTFVFVKACDVEPGWHVLARLLNDSVSALVVSEVRLQRRRGAFAPITAAGVVLSGGVLASCYANTDDHHGAHAGFWGARLWAYFSLLSAIPLL